MQRHAQPWRCNLLSPAIRQAHVTFVELFLYVSQVLPLPRHVGPSPACCSRGRSMLGGHPQAALSRALVPSGIVSEILYTSAVPWPPESAGALLPIQGSCMGLSVYSTADHVSRPPPSTSTQSSERM